MRNQQSAWRTPRRAITRPNRSCICFLLLVLSGGCRTRTPVEEVTVDVSGVAIDDLAPFEASDRDWPGWRGPDSNGVARAADAPVRWSEDSDQIVWQADVPGRGHSSPVVLGDLVLLATALETEQQQMVAAYDRRSGVLRWQTVVHVGNFPSSRELHPKSTHANGTVAVDDQRIYIAFLNDDAIFASALDRNGEIVWQTRLGAFASKFGYAPSPLVYKSFVIFAADNMGGGYLTALHRATGDVAWRKARPAVSTYSSPVVARTGGRDQLLISGCDRVSSYDPETGAELWECAGTSEATCGTMVWNDEIVFAAGGYPDRQVIAVRADGTGEVVWTSATKVYEPSLLLWEDQLYAVTDEGVAFCWDAASGRTHWKKRLGGSFSASPVACNGLIYAGGAGGETFVFRAASAGYQQVARNQLGADAYASPAVCDGRIYLRVGLPGAPRSERLYCLGQPDAT